ncbi:MAG: protoporphyrinogen oxidase [Acidobacteria bacterium]|nr:MAG: protoporphyrinogen oxidase [Acidobacteriota bacterium]PYQ88603.1 MAG: protoporphyrinogen oxidase [Acidobacteriota bacterium]PYR06991.1 MAG: protoporphyrinogen oxidase [Acidobacteriota bacterium]
MLDCVIVGGGIAGLASAYELSRRGVSFVLLERAARAGGVILSEEIDGFVIDGGPDALLIQKPDGIKLCEELGLGDRLVSTKPPRLAYIQRGGQLHALPAASVLGIPTRVGPFVSTRLFSWLGKLRMGAELFVPARRDEGDESIGSFMTRRFGREATTYLAEPLLAGIHAGDVDRLSIRALFPRFVEAERTHGSLLKAFRSNPNPASPANPESQIPNPGKGNGAFKSLAGGLSELIRALVSVLPSGSICLNSTVSRITEQREHGSFRVERASGDAIAARAVVIATPAYATSSLTRELDGEISGIFSEIRYASAATIVLAFPRRAVAHPLNGSGFVVPRVENTGIMAASWLSSKWPDRAPDDKVLLRTFVGGARDPKALEESDAELVSRSMRALRPLLGITGEPLLSRVYRWDRANAQHEVGHLDRVAAIERALTHHPGLFVTGSGFRGTGIPDCVADGRATGKQLAEWLRA